MIIVQSNITKIISSIVKEGIDPVHCNKILIKADEFCLDYVKIFAKELLREGVIPYISVDYHDIIKESILALSEENLHKFLLADRDLLNMFNCSIYIVSYESYKELLNVLRVSSRKKQLINRLLLHRSYLQSYVRERKKLLIFLAPPKNIRGIIKAYELLERQTNTHYF